MKKFERTLLAASLMAVGSAPVVPALAQSGNENVTLEEIIVTARRRDESLQDVPVTVNAVTADQIRDLNIRDVESLQSVVAGLTLQEDTIAPNASLRGVRFDTFASGNNATVEFYLNDAPISSQSAMQALFDVSQIEVLRGPQGTLRGRASPSGSITITTQRPILDEFGGYIDLTATDIDGNNARGALNIPIVENMLGVRVSGFWEENNINDVSSVFTGDTSEYEGHGYRLSVGFEPTDTITLNAMYQKVKPDREIWYPVESAHIIDPSLAPSDPFIEAEDRHAVMDTPEFTEQEQERFNLEASWVFAGQQLTYVYSETEQSVIRHNPVEVDPTNAIDADGPDAWQNLSQFLDSVQESGTHEIRLQSDEPLFGKIDYVVGFLQAENEPITHLLNPTLLAVFAPTGAPPPNDYVGPVAHSVTQTPITTGNETDEQSWFANVTYHITDRTDVSAGLRRIDYEFDQNLIVNGTKLIGPGNVFGPAGDDGHREWEETIYSFSVSHDFTEDFMGYFSYGTSWRPGVTAVGDFSLLQSELQESFTTLPPEESESFELGFKSTWLDDRLRVNATVFHQEFDDYPYRAGGEGSGGGIYFISYSANRDAQGNVIGLTPEVDQHNFVAAVPVEVNGVEIETSFRATDDWDLGALFSYAKGEIDDGLVPCNDYLPHDGVPDSGGVPTLNDIAAATGGLFTGDNLAACNVDFRSNFAPLWTATLTSEYRFPLGAATGYVRGLWTLYGDSENDPSNPVDDVDSYNILNLYAGMRDPDGNWEAMIYGKNIFETEEILRRS